MTAVASLGSAVFRVPLGHDPETLRRRARDLLARPPYTDSDPGPVTDVLDRLRQWLADVLDAVLGAVAGSTTFAWLVVGLATVAVLALVLRFSRGVSVDGGAPPTTSAAARRSATAWREQAVSHAAAGRWDAAIRAGYAALVTQLVEDGVLTDADARTVGEIDTAVDRDAPERAADVRAAGAVFEDVWYGHRQADEAGYRLVLDAASGRVRA